MINPQAETLPLLSIITPTLNHGQFIEETIQSVISQNYPHVEHIVMDGGSTDRTVEILKKYSHLDWVSEKDRGQADAVNKGIAKAKGDIIGWVNSDDLFLPGAFDAVTEYFRTNAECSVVFGNYHAVDEQGNILYSTEGFCGTYDEMIRWWDYTYAIHQPTVFVRTNVFAVAGKLDATFHYAMDYEWWLRVARNYRFHHIPRFLATYRMHSNAKTFAPLEKYVYPEQLRASKKHWGYIWETRYWNYWKSYRRYRLRKPTETLHNPALELWHEKAKQGL